MIAASSREAFDDVPRITAIPLGSNVLMVTLD